MNQRLLLKASRSRTRQSGIRGLVDLAPRSDNRAGQQPQNRIFRLEGEKAYIQGKKAMARTSEARIFIRISHAHKRKLKQLAKERGRTLSAFIRESFIL